MATIHINRSGTNLGTFSEDDVRAGLKAGRFVGTDLAWREGMSAWQPLSQFSEFAADFSAAPTAQSIPVGAPPPSAAGSIPPGTLAPPPAQAVVPGSGLPWDRRNELGFFKAFIETLQMVLSRPTDAFTAMKREGGLGEPLLYALIGGTFGLIANLIYRFGMMAMGGPSSSSGTWGALGLLCLIILSPLFIIAVLFISAGLIHLCLMLVVGARQKFETTFRVICFAAGSVNPLQLVPLCGGLIAGVWGLVLYCIGLSRAHEIDTGRAVLAVFLPLVLCCGGGVLLAFVAGGLGALSHTWH